jgi:hypothetical protein
MDQTAIMNIETYNHIERLLQSIACVPFIVHFPDALHEGKWVSHSGRPVTMACFEEDLLIRGQVAEVINGVVHIKPDPRPTDTVLALRWVGTWDPGQTPQHDQYSWFDDDYQFFWRCDRKHIEALGARLRAGTAPANYREWRNEVYSELEAHW